MESFEGFSGIVLPIAQACAALVAVILSISQLTAKSRHMKSAAFWRDELKVTENSEYLLLARKEHLKASAKVYAESTTPSMKLLGLYTALTAIFLLLFAFSVALKQAIATPEMLSEFIKIGFFPVALLVLSVGAIKALQDMHLRKSYTLLAIVNGIPVFPGNKLLPYQGLAYLGSTSYALGLASLFFNFALTSPFPVNTNFHDSTLETVTYVIALILIPFGMLTTAARKPRIQQSAPIRRRRERANIPWLTHSLKHVPASAQGIAKNRVRRRHTRPEESNAHH